jgi:hypothetical protein
MPRKTQEDRVRLAVLAAAKKCLKTTGLEMLGEVAVRSV